MASKRWRFGVMPTEGTAYRVCILQPKAGGHVVAWTLEWGFASPLAAERRCRQWRKGEWSPQELHEHLDGMVRLELNRCRPCIRDDYLQERESNDGE